MCNYDEFCRKFGKRPTSIFKNPKLKATSYFFQFKDIDDWYDNNRRNRANSEQRRCYLRSDTEEMALNPDGSRKEVDILDFVATDPEVVERGIGLQPWVFSTQEGK